MTDTEPYIKPGIYRHYKGNSYRVYGTVQDADSLEWRVYYGKDGQKPRWDRLYHRFVASVRVDGEEVPRFQYLGD